MWLTAIVPVLHIFHFCWTCHNGQCGWESKDLRLVIMPMFSFSLNHPNSFENNIIKNEAHRVCFSMFSLNYRTCREQHNVSFGKQNILRTNITSESLQRKKTKNISVHTSHGWFSSFYYMNTLCIKPALLDTLFWLINHATMSTYLFSK